MNRKLKTQLTSLIAIGFVFWMGLFFSACEAHESKSEETAIDSLANEVAAVMSGAKPVQEEEAASEDSEISEEDLFPKEKSAADLEILKEMRESAFEGEKAFFETPRIKSWVSKLADGEDEDGMPIYGKLEIGKFHQMTPKEAFYYYFVHPELWDQICAEASFESGNVVAIARNLPWTGDGDYASERQINLIKENLDVIQPMILACMKQQMKVSPEMMAAIVELKIKAAVPVLLEIFDAQAAPKDDLILTTLVTLMDFADFKQWEDSEVKKAFGEKWYGAIELNQGNIDKIKFYAKKFGES